MRAKTIIILVTLLALMATGRPAWTGSLNPDSGIYGTVPHQAEDLRELQQRIDSLKPSLLAPSRDVRKNALGYITSWQATIDKMRKECVQAFDPKSELPPVNSWTAHPKMSGYISQDDCWDFERFPRGFMKLLGVAPCDDDGKFRLALPAGRYAVFIGQAPVGRAGGGDQWWRYLDVKPHQWLQITEPVNYQEPNPCKSDADCLWSGETCNTFQANIPPGTTKLCSLHERIPPDFYNSGVQGRGAPVEQGCSGIEGSDMPVDRQCVEAFPEGSPYIVACAACRLSDGAFVLPLAPGRYTLEFKMLKGDGWERETHSADVVSGKWIDLYAFGSKPGPIHFKPCPPME